DRSAGSRDVPRLLRRAARAAALAGPRAARASRRPRAQPRTRRAVQLPVLRRGVREPPDRARPPGRPPLDRGGPRRRALAAEADQRQPSAAPRRRTAAVTRAP